MISFLPEHYFVIGVLMIFSFFSFYSLSLKFQFPVLTLGNVIAGLVLIINFILLTVFDLVYDEVFFNAFFYKSNLHSFLHLFLSFILIFLLPSSYFFNKINKLNTFEFYNLVLISFFSLILLVNSRELMSFFFLLEIQGICFYILAAYNRGVRFSIEAGIKYFILSSFSSILILLGFSLLYSITGLMDFTELYYYFLSSESNVFIHCFSFLLVFTGFLFKLYHFPFHFWVADIYEHAPFSSVVIFSSLPVINFFYTFYVVSYYCYGSVLGYFKTLLSILVVCTMVIGTLFALYQKNIKRILAYSSVTNIGYIMSSFLSNNVLFFSSGFFFIVVYVLSLLGVFLLFLSLFDFSRKVSITSLSSLSGFYKTHTLICIILCLNLFCLAGLPPFGFFFAKILLLTILLSESYYIIIFFIVFATFVGCYIYLRLIKIMTYNAYTDYMYLKPMSFFTSYSIMLILLAQLYIMVFHSSFFNFLYGISLF